MLKICSVHTVLMMPVIVAMCGFLQPAAADTGVVKLTNIAYATNSQIIDKNTPGEEPIPGMSVTFSNGNVRERAIIQFCAEGNMYKMGSGSVQITPIVDGLAVGAQVQYFTSANTAVLPHCFEWVSPLLGTGSHTVSMAWDVIKDPNDSLTARLHESVMSVHYR